ncbi:acyl carrier protein [Campylobacter peloridis]|uniref:Acyl carrier protein n=1 Tax=Campylobacter peloridis TaxID=488546 RepID=A0A5C7DNS6_9BACT|nr:acyl carrier protein [Campylobacter peloridis]AJC84166.1 acyl carrier protein [Campylobacter peloridis LMG 23910]MBX1885387.1 acyl carrier protein [Campylobacter peloridis]MBX2079107.1 acyl carrier protein [Campylobacter peloridis]QOQ88267.1 acyl carrier protein [Campylobacter peloridis]TXE83649.1 acyl carrier protein [Campylobacter peloridis]
MATFDDVKAVVVEQLSVDEDAVKMESKIIEDLGADSLDVVELVMALEEKFDVEIPDSDAEKLVKIEDVVNYIDNLQK